MLEKIDMPLMPFTVNFAWFQTPTFERYKFFDISNKNNSLYFRLLDLTPGREGCKGKGCATPGRGGRRGKDSIDNLLNCSSSWVRSQAHIYCNLEGIF